MAFVRDWAKTNPSLPVLVQLIRRQFRSRAVKNVLRQNTTSHKDEDLSCVLYHYPCIDGAFAALAAHLYHKCLSLPVIFLPNSVTYPLRFEDFCKRRFRTCYLLDFVGPDKFVNKISKIVDEVVILDHHKTADDILLGDHSPNVLSIVDMNKSAATIAYQYFSEKLAKNTGFKICENALVNRENLNHVELLFRYIEDADLWKWSLPESKAFAAGLSSMRIQLNAIGNPQMFDQLLELDPAALIANGRKYIKIQEKMIDKLLHDVFEIRLGQGTFGKCLGVRADTCPDLRSQIGSLLSIRSAEQGMREIGAVIYEQAGMLKVSLRTTNKSVDTTEISKVYGGGGHPAASSFLLCKEEFTLWRC